MGSLSLSLSLSLAAGKLKKFHFDPCLQKNSFLIDRIRFAYFYRRTAMYANGTTWGGYLGTKRYKRYTMGSSVASQNQTKKFAETGSSQWSYIVMAGAKIFDGYNECLKSYIASKVGKLLISLQWKPDFEKLT